MEFVILKSFSNYMDAHIILGRMKEEGIHCWLKNENSVTIVPIWTNALGGIQLMVNAAQQKKAANILHEIEEERKEVGRSSDTGEYRSKRWLDEIRKATF